jgi:hypothetical protein
MERIEVIVPRESDSNVYATVSCEESEAIQNGNELLEALCRAVTKWVQTDDGKSLFIYAADDLNIGDLAGNGIDDTLIRLLEYEGVKDFQIGHPDRCDWNYDTRLVDMNSLPEDFGEDL